VSLPILATKLYIPRLRDRIVKRTHLIKRLSQDEDYRLILISAPAGFGKSTLVSEWLTVCGYSASWLSLDVRDNDLRTFLTYFITGIQRIDKEIGSRAMEVLATQPSYRLEVLLNDIINEIAALSYRIVYVLDDYHVINNREINTAIEYLLVYMPANMQLVILTREEPQLPIANLRAVYCKIKLPKVAKQKRTLLHVHFGQSCNV
jgi:LuxR family maltose regulon positive regulatory protein